jgi:hypothetical protein
MSVERGRNRNMRAKQVQNLERLKLETKRGEHACKRSPSVKTTLYPAKSTTGALLGNYRKNMPTVKQISSCSK